MLSRLVVKTKQGSSLAFHNRTARKQDLSQRASTRTTSRLFHKTRMSEKIVIASPHAPPAIGPYSQAIKANGFLFVSGCIGMNLDGNLVAADIESQTTKALDNMKHILEAGGSSLKEVVKVTVLLRQMSDYATVNKIYATYFTEAFPARAAYAVAGLPKDALIEIECVAVAH